MKIHPIVVAIAAGTTVAVLWISTMLLVLCGRNLPASGQFGDSFGALNCLFTGLALAAVAATFLHERQRATESQGEFEKVLNALTTTAAALNEQAQSASRSLYLQALSERIRAFPAELKFRGDTPEAKNDLSPRLYAHLEELHNLLRERQQQHPGYAAE